MSESGRAADHKTNGFVHLGSHSLLRNKTVNFVLPSPQTLSLESSFSDVTALLYYTGACPKENGSCFSQGICLFTFLLFYSDLGALWLAICLRLILLRLPPDVYFVIWRCNVNSSWSEPSLLVIVSDSSRGLLSRVASLS